MPYPEILDAVKSEKSKRKEFKVMINDDKKKVQKMMIAKKE
jgi:hypothetical protein